MKRKQEIATTDMELVSTIGGAVSHPKTFMLPIGSHSVMRAEVYNKKKDGWEIRDFVVQIKLVKNLRTDKTLKIYYETI